MESAEIKKGQEDKLSLELAVRGEVKKFNALLRDKCKFEARLKCIGKCRSKLSNEYGRDNLEELSNDELKSTILDLQSRLNLIMDNIKLTEYKIAEATTYIENNLEKLSKYQRLGKSNVELDRELLGLQKMLKKHISLIQDLLQHVRKIEVEMKKEEELLNKELQKYSDFDRGEPDNILKINSITSIIKLEQEVAENTALDEKMLKELSFREQDIQESGNMLKCEALSYHLRGISVDIHDNVAQIWR